MISFICSGCGGFGHTPEDSLDSGTALTCDGCGAQTIVELFSPAGYKKRNDMEAQNPSLNGFLQDLRGLLAEQPKESSRPFILEARRRVAAYDERWAHKPQCLGTTPGHCECGNCTMERAKQDKNRCFCAGTWHCRWCGHEPCTCDPKRVSDLGRVDPGQKKQKGESTQDARNHPPDVSTSGNENARQW